MAKSPLSGLDDHVETESVDVHAEDSPRGDRRKHREGVEDEGGMPLWLKLLIGLGVVILLILFSWGIYKMFSGGSSASPDLAANQIKDLQDRLTEANDRANKLEAEKRLLEQKAASDVIPRGSSRASSVMTGPRYSGWVGDATQQNPEDRHARQLDERDVAKAKCEAEKVAIALKAATAEGQLTASQAETKALKAKVKDLEVELKKVSGELVRESDAHTKDVRKFGREDGAARTRIARLEEQLRCCESNAKAVQEIKLQVTCVAPDSPAKPQVTVRPPAPKPDPCVPKVGF